MEKIVRMEHIHEYNEMMGAETLHPLVCVIDFSKCHKTHYARRTFGFYAVFLKEVECGNLIY